MSVAGQALGRAERAILAYPADPAIAAAADRINGLVSSYSGAWCARWGDADPGVADAFLYRMFCSAWEEQLTAALVDLAELEAARGDTLQAEATLAAAEQTTTPGEQAAATTDVSAPTLWANTPGVVKAIIGLGLAILALQAAGLAK